MGGYLISGPKGGLVESRGLLQNLTAKGGGGLIEGAGPGGGVNRAFTVQLTRTSVASARCCCTLKFSCPPLVAYSRRGWLKFRLQGCR